MKKNSFKKILALTLVCLMSATIFAGCALVVHNDDRYLENVVLRIDPVEMEYNVPFYVDYLDNLDRVVAAKNQKGEAVPAYGSTLTAVQRDHDGKAIHKPLIGDGKIQYFTDEDIAGSDKTIRQTYSGEDQKYYIVYDLADGKAVSATEYAFDGFVSTTSGQSGYGVAVWRNVETGESVKARGIKDTTSYETGATMAGVLPDIHFTKDNCSDWYYIAPEPKMETGMWTTDAKEFTKQELMSMFSRSGQSYLDEGYDLKQTYTRLLRTMYSAQFMLYEAENHIKSGDVEWGITEQNVVNRYFYQAVDNELSTQFVSIMKETDPSYTAPASEEEKKPTYPLPPKEDTGPASDYYVWTPDSTDYLGLGTTSERTSLVREGVRRWVSSLPEVLKNDHTISASQRAVYEAELDTLKGMLTNNEQLLKIYPSLLDKNDDGSYKYSVIWYLYGLSYDKSLKVNALTGYIGMQKEVDEEKVRTLYNDYLAEQKTAYGRDNAAFASAMGGDNVIFYYASDEYFYVKQILLPFPELITSKIENISGTGSFTDIQIKALSKDIASRDNATAYPVYAHKDGENDTSKAYTVNQVYTEMKTKVNAAATEKEKERAFEELVFKYNTDTGIFNKEMGYVVTATPALDGGEPEKYVIEFATAARDLRAKYLSSDIATRKLGMLSEPVLTTYGYHVLFLLKVPSKGDVTGLYDYMTIGQRSRIYDMLAVSTLTSARDEAYNSWSNERTSYYEKKSVIKDTEYEKNWKDLYEKK